MIKARETAFSAGMKKPGDKFAFMPFGDIEAKLNELETERTFFWKTCPAECRADYEFGKESKLTHVVIEHLPEAYAATVKDVKNAVKLRKMVAGDISAGYTTGQDLAMQTFSSDWLPPYLELRTALVESYHSFVKTWSVEGKIDKKSPSMMMVGGHQQPGSDALTCYACGIVGHKRGDSVCEASSSAIWAGAPEAWKKRQKKGKGKGGGRGNGDAKRKQKGRG
jgi:hypothetical protein